jgi:hypothetical protein
MAAARSRAIGLDHRPADVVAAERAEQARKAAAYDDAVSVLEAKLGPSWTIGCPTVAEALVEPHTLRVLLGVPHPGPEASEARFREVAGDYAEALAAMQEVCPGVSNDGLADNIRAFGDRLSRLETCEAELAEAIGRPLMRAWPDMLDVVRKLATEQREPAPTTIDDSTPEGVLALLDAAIDALVRDDEAHLAESLIDERDGLAFELGGGLRDDDRFNKRRVDQLAARLGLDKPVKPPRSKVESMAADLAERLDSGRLLARILDECAKLPGYLAEPELTGHAARSIAERLAALVLALGIVLGRTDTTGGAF